MSSLEKLESPFARVLIVVLVTAVGLAWLLVQGPIAVVRGSAAIDQTVPLWYNITAFPVLGFLSADLLALWVVRRFEFPTIELAVSIVLLVVISALRITLQIPVSGHCLLFSYFIGRRLLVGPPSEGWFHGEVLVGAGLFGMAVSRKIFGWGDVTTFATGSVIGFVLAGVSYALTRKNTK